MSTHITELPDDIYSDGEDFDYQLNNDEIEEIIDLDNDIFDFEYVDFDEELKRYNEYIKNKENKEKYKNSIGVVVLGGMLTGGAGYLFGMTAGLIGTIGTVATTAVTFSNS